MTPYTFDTLDASKRLREAGMEEGVAEAVVAVFQHAIAWPDFGNLATKADIADMATKADIETLQLATKADIETLRLATKAEIEALSLATKTGFSGMATKKDLEGLQLEMKADLMGLEVRIGERMRNQMLQMGGFMLALFSLFVAVMKLVP